MMHKAQPDRPQVFTSTVTGDLQGPSNLIWLSKNVFPPGMTMVGLQLSPQVAFHVAANALGRTEDAQNLISNVNQNHRSA
jgi:hypothetical protein